MNINPLSFQGINHQTLTRVEFYNRFNTLANLEEELADKGEKLSFRDATELEALAKLMQKEKSSILFSKEIVKINDSEYYYVQFNENILKINKLKEQIQNTWKIQNVDEMARLFTTKTWYKNGIINQTTSDYFDLMGVYKDSHKINIDIIRIIKKLEALQTDVIVSDIYPKLKDLFLKFFGLYRIQQSFNCSCSLHAIAMLTMYKEAFDHQWL